MEEKSDMGCGCKLREVWCENQKEELDIGLKLNGWLGCNLWMDGDDDSWEFESMRGGAVWRIVSRVHYTAGLLANHSRWINFEVSGGSWMLLIQMIRNGQLGCAQ